MTSTPKNGEALRKVSAALQKENWDLIVQMARDPATVEAVTSAKVGWGGGTALHMATYCHKLEISKVLLLAGALLSSRDKEGYTPLHIAALSGSAEVAELLLSKGADVSTVNAYGWTPLHASAVNGHLKVAETLLKYGADPSIQAKDGRVALDISNSRGHKAFCELLKRSQTKGSRGPRTKRRILMDTDDPSDEESEGLKSASVKRLKSSRGGETSSRALPEDENKKEEPDDDKNSDFKPEAADAEVDDDEVEADFERACSRKQNLVQQHNSSTTEGRVKPNLGSRNNASPQGVGRSSGLTPGVQGRQSYPTTGEVLRAANDYGNGARPTDSQAGPSAAPGGPFLRPVPIRPVGAAQPVFLPKWTSPDIGRLSVASVANLLTKYVSEGHDEATKQVFKDKIVKGVFAFKLTGRVLIANEPSPSELATAIILCEGNVGYDANSRRVQRDVLFYSITEFIRVARSLRVPSPFFYTPAMGTPQGVVRSRATGSPTT